MSTVLRRVRLGIAVGLFGATVLSIWVLALALLSNSATIGGGSEPLDAGRVVAAYYAAGVACGAVGGLLAPLGRWRVGAAAVGMAGAVALYGAIEVVRHAGRPWVAEDYVVLAILGVVVGAPAGLIYRDIFLTGRRHRSADKGSRGRSSPPVA